MPVTIRPVPHASRRWSRYTAATSTEVLLRGSCPSEYKRCKEIIQSSFSRFSTQPPIYPFSNGFVRAAMAAYSGHHHLTIRPEDVWFAILTQLSFFVNAHAEELRAFFVPHAGRKELEVFEGSSIHSANFGAMAKQMTKLMAKNLNDPELLPWIIPSFSTTKDTDRVVASILMMGAMQKYFSYRSTQMCGIPSVTLLGERSDWEEILLRLEKLPNLGSEPGQFYSLLKPVLTYFVASFDSPTAPSIIDFWSKIVHESHGSGSSSLSGWIVAFCFWDENGKSLYAPPGTGAGGPVNNERRRARMPVYDLDGTLYHRIGMKKIPAGFASVPVTLDYNGHVYEAIMVAGSVGIQVTSSGQLLDVGIYSRSSLGSATPTGEPGPDSLQPVTGWWMYEKVGTGGGCTNNSEVLHFEKKGSTDADVKEGREYAREPVSELKAVQDRKEVTTAA